MCQTARACVYDGQVKEFMKLDGNTLSNLPKSSSHIKRNPESTSWQGYKRFSIHNLNFFFDKDAQIHHSRTTNRRLKMLFQILSKIPLHENQTNISD